MADDEVFLRNIPKFMRRPHEPLPEAPMFMTPRAAASPPPAHVPEAIQAPMLRSGRRPGALVPPPRRLPASVESAMTEAATAAEVAGSGVVDLRALRPQPLAAKAPADFFADARAGIESLFAADAQDLLDDGDDAAFQVTLPRSVIRQIRILAAQEGTTQRAIALKALRLAGLVVPDGADIDRRILAGKRRQQA